MNIEETINIEANKMLEKYYPYYFKKYPRNKYQVKAKYFKYFEQAAKKFCIRDNYDAEKLITSFMMDGFKYPQQLPNEAVWKTYLSYLPAIHNKKTKEVEIIEKIIEASIEIKRNENVNNFLNKKINQITIEENKLKFDPLLLSFSYCFENYCRMNNLNYNIQSLRNEVLSLDNKINRDKILNKIKDFLKDDYYENCYNFLNECREKNFIF